MKSEKPVKKSRKRKRNRRSKAKTMQDLGLEPWPTSYLSVYFPEEHYTKEDVLEALKKKRGDKDG